MKREFAFDDALRMLEVTWSSLPCKPRQEELALYEHIPEMSAVSQPIPLPRVRAPPHRLHRNNLGRTAVKISL